MKRICWLSVFLALLLGWSFSALAHETLHGYSKENGYQYITFGRFPQTADGKEEPILWRVLSASDHEAYLLSEYILFNNRVHPDDNAYAACGGAFNQTEIYALLNGPFDRIVLSAEEEERLRRRTYYGYAYDAEMSFLEQAFSEAEKAQMIEDGELGYVFLASADDLKNPDYGFTDSKSMRAYGTDYAMTVGLFQYSNGSSPYWTRTQSSDFPYGTRCTKEKGNLGYIRCVVMNEGIRPAIRLRIDVLEFADGDGTFDHPYTIQF